MEIRIGIRQAQRELAFESSTDAAELEGLVEQALADDSASLKLTDTKGHTYIVSSTALAYVEIGTEETRRIGFGA